MNSALNRDLPVVSIIIPVYGVEDYIEECLSSVIIQDYEGKIECILIDDCSNDKSVEYAESLISEYVGPIDFSILHNEKNVGLSAVRNTGIKMAKGDYLYFLDSDDTIVPDCISGMVWSMGRNMNTEMVVAGAVTSFGEKWLSMTRCQHFPDYTEDREWIKCNMLIQTIPMTAWNKLVKKSLLIENNLFFYEGIVNEDELWNFQLAKYIKSVVFHKRDTYIYRIRLGSIQNNHALDSKRWISVQIIIKSMIDQTDEFLEKEQLFCVFYRLLQWLAAPLPSSTIPEIKNWVRYLKKKCDMRQRIGVFLLLSTPLSVLRSFGPSQKLLVDIFGQHRCRRYKDYGLRSYFSY